MRRFSGSAALLALAALVSFAATWSTTSAADGIFMIPKVTVHAYGDSHLTLDAWTVHVDENGQLSRHALPAGTYRLSFFFEVAESGIEIPYLLHYAKEFRNYSRTVELDESGHLEFDIPAPRIEGRTSNVFTFVRLRSETMTSEVYHNTVKVRGEMPTAFYLNFEHGGRTMEQIVKSAEIAHPRASE